MPPKKLSRTSYRDPTQTTNPVRLGDVARGEAAADMDEFYRPLEQVHGSGPHGWGVADGLRVTATLNNSGINVLPGVGIDIQGRHVALAEGGNAEIGANADVAGTSPILASVAAAGAILPTVTLAAGNFYLTIQWWETFDSDAYNNYGVYRVNHTPWLRLLAVGGFADDGSRLVLARVTLAASGLVTAMNQELRRLVSLPAQVLRLRKSVVASGSPNFAIDNSASGEIRARSSGGMELAVPAAADEIHLVRDGAGNFAKLSVAAEQIVARRSDGLESVKIDTRVGNLTVGTKGVEGDVLVKDATDRLVITLDSHDAALVVGANGKEGDILVKDNRGQDSTRIDGQEGSVFTRRLGTISADTLDVDARYFRIHGWDLCLDGRSHGNKRALVDDINNTLTINYANDYSNGVSINGLHLADHIRVGYWEESSEWNPGRYFWHTFFELDTGLLSSKWCVITTCEIGMLDEGTVDAFFWETSNQSFVNSQGNCVVRWNIRYVDDGTDWYPWQRSVTWLAFRL